MADMTKRHEEFDAVTGFGDYRRCEIVHEGEDAAWVTVLESSIADMAAGFQGPEAGVMTAQEAMAAYPADVRYRLRSTGTPVAIRSYAVDTEGNVTVTTVAIDAGLTIVQGVLSGNMREGVGLTDLEHETPRRLVFRPACCFASNSTCLVRDSRQAS